MRAGSSSASSSGGKGSGGVASCRVAARVESARGNAATRARALGSGLGSGINDAVLALTVFDDGGGPALYAGGGFMTAGGWAGIAKWNGSSWSAVGSGVNSSVHTLTVFDDGSGPALFAGGVFGRALDSGDSYLAKWGCPDTTGPVLSCPGSIAVIDRLGDGAGEIVTFSVSATDDHDPSPTVLCAPPSGGLYPPGTTLVDCTATDASGNQSTCQFPVTVQRKARPQ